MTNELKASLENAIEEWIIQISEGQFQGDGLFYPDIAEDMAQAAGAVFDSCFRGQAYAEKEKV